MPPPPVREINAIDGLAQLSFVVHGFLERWAAENDLSLIQTRLLGVLRDRQPTMNELAKLLALDKSSITGLVARAERRGLVARVPSTVDRRSVQVRLTAEGRKLVSRVGTSFEADVMRLMSHLRPVDRRKLSSLVSQVLVAYARERDIDLFATLETRFSHSRLEPGEN